MVPATYNQIDAEQNHRNAQKLPHRRAAEKEAELPVRLTEKFDTETKQPVAGQKTT